MMIFRFAAYVAFLGLSTSALAQDAKAPEKTSEAKQAEEALRAQVGKFYGLLGAGKPRAAEALVCEASKDQFYAMKKSAPRSSDVRTVTLSADLQSAQVITAVEDEYSLGFEKKLIKMPMPSQWKLEAGQWCYFLPADTGIIDTPFGKMDLRNDGKSKQGDVFPSTSQPPVTTTSLSHQVSFSKRVLALPYDADGKDEIVVSNGLPGPIQFRMSCPDVPGLVCRMDQDNISAGKTGKLIVEFTFKGKKIQESAEVAIWVLPFNAMSQFPIQRLVQAPKPAEPPAQSKPQSKSKSK